MISAVSCDQLFSKCNMILWKDTDVIDQSQIWYDLMISLLIVLIEQMDYLKTKQTHIQNKTYHLTCHMRCHDNDVMITQ